MKSILAYRPEIDGLRAFAVISVIVFHYDETLLSGGFFGVDVFFVISGFLITSILLKEHHNNKFSLKNFWLRRIRRILPALCTVIIVCQILAYFTIFRNDLDSLGEQSLTSLLSVSNLYFWTLTRDYWGIQPIDSWLLNIWSLSLEEQFYFIYPIFLFFILRYKNKSFLLLSNLIITILSIFIYCYYGDAKPNASFYLLPFRFWEINLGCILAISCTKRVKFYNKIKNLDSLTILSFFILAISFIFLNNETDNIIKVLCVLNVVFLIISLENDSFIKDKFISNKVIVYIGKVSYSLYLWHWPILHYKNISNYEFLNYSWPILLIIISILSYHFIENPFRKTKSNIYYIILLFIFSFISSIFLTFNKFYYDHSIFNKTTWCGPKYELLINNEEPKDLTQNKRFSGISIEEKPQLSYKSDSKYLNQNFNIVVLGNSHALMWSPVIDEIAEELNLHVDHMGKDQIFPFIRNFNITNDVIDDYDSIRIKKIVQKPTLVFLCANWSWAHNFKEEIENFVEFVNLHNGIVVFLGQPPILNTGNHSTPDVLMHMGAQKGKDFLIDSAYNTDVIQGNDKIKRLTVNNNSYFIPTYDIYFDYNNDKVIILKDNNVFYIDDDHLSLEGARLAKKRIKDRLLDQNLFNKLIKNY